MFRFVETFRMTLSYNSVRVAFQRFCSVSLVTIISAAAHAQGADAATDLVGRNGQFIVKTKGGTVETADTKQLSLQKDSIPSAPRAVVSDAGGAETDSSEKSPPEAPRPKAGTASNTKTAAPKEETPEEKAIRAVDVEELRAMRKQGGAYFYTEDDKPVSFEEIDRRIAAGEVEGLKAVGLHLEDWKPLTKSKSTGDAEAAAEPTPRESAPKDSNY